MEEAFLAMEIPVGGEAPTLPLSTFVCLGTLLLHGSPLTHGRATSSLGRFASLILYFVHKVFPRTLSPVRLASPDPLCASSPKVF